MFRSYARTKDETNETFRFFGFRPTYSVDKGTSLWFIIASARVEPASSREFVLLNDFTDLKQINSLKKAAFNHTLK